MTKELSWRFQVCLAMRNRTMVEYTHLSSYIILHCACAAPTTDTGDENSTKHGGMDTVRSCRLWPADIPAPSSECFCDFGEHGCGQRDAEENEGLVNSICQSELGPQSYRHVSMPFRNHS